MLFFVVIVSMVKLKKVEKMYGFFFCEVWRSIYLIFIVVVMFVKKVNFDFEILK